MKAIFVIILAHLYCVTVRALVSGVNETIDLDLALNPPAYRYVISKFCVGRLCRRHQCQHQHV